MKKIISILTIILTTIFILTACGSTKSKLLGRWEGDKDYLGISAYEFFDDGTYWSSDQNFRGNYTVNDNRLRIDGILVSPRVMDFEVNGDTLVLTIEGETSEFKRVE